MKVEKLYQNSHPNDRASYFLTEVICGDIVRQNQTLYGAYIQINSSVPGHVLLSDI